MNHPTRLFGILLVITLAMMLVACGGAEEEQPPAEEAESAPEAEEAAPAEESGEATEEEAESAADAQAADEGVMEADFSTLEEEGYTLMWRVNGDMLDLVVAYETTGWLSVGFDPSRMMQDANIIIGYVADGTATISDQYGTGPTAHAPDTEIGGSNDLSNISGTEEDGRTELRLSMPLDSGDSSDTVLSEGSTHTVLLAHGPDGADDFVTYHEGRIVTEIEL